MTAKIWNSFVAVFFIFFFLVECRTKKKKNKIFEGTSGVNHCSAQYISWMK